ncbi:hypothetical protein DS909_07640 [Phaeobacter gallaeciensis]|uniref:Uncharacterized protein n=1 Tax=Phaeobacter gallaeciensis TaxID=60890 RepID=A0A366X5L9_9RHOB|nr:hypothetical protein DS909_07640 [Phaeobacter gallaeciensis]
MFQTARLFEANQPATLAAAHAKKFANTTANAGLSWAMRAMESEGKRLEIDQFGRHMLHVMRDGQTKPPPRPFCRP